MKFLLLHNTSQARIPLSFKVYTHHLLMLENRKPSWKALVEMVLSLAFNQEHLMIVFNLNKLT